MIKSKLYNGKAVIRIKSGLCETTEDVLSSQFFREVVTSCIKELEKNKSPLLGIFNDRHNISKKDIDLLIRSLRHLCKMPPKAVAAVVEGSDVFFQEPNLLADFVHALYEFWISFERFTICEAEGEIFDKRLSGQFNRAVDKLNQLIQKAYQDIEDNISSKYVRIHRQVIAGGQIAAVGMRRELPYPKLYQELNKIQIIRQVLLYPPLVLDPSMNKRTGQFIRIDENPIKHCNIDPDQWLCYPAKVGPLFINIYFHENFMDLGLSLCNLFELASPQELKRKPDAVYLFGVPENALDQLAPFPTVFYEDKEEGMMVAAVPKGKEFGYFGYLKKMVLTLHNIIMMKKGKWPFHGALVRISLKSGKSATILLIGDTGAGKSEMLEAFRVISEEEIQEMVIIADDMGSLVIDDSNGVLGYGTEIGAFLRLDDLQTGYAFGQMHRSIIMSAARINARILLPVTDMSTVTKGQPIDFILYCNNYENVDIDHPVMERFNDYKEALEVFEKGAVMSKGTTTSKGLVYNYFANIFGPVQYRELHDELAEKYFAAFFEKDIYVGQLRTRLGVSGWEFKGPEEAARELANAIRNL
ncbi:phosphoenolpyruvate carboxykinase [Heliorestis acidaminivorans]|uniref:Phosphoenolpyruvate carboxykinase n=1 Tax=Heliorestis acidaminivorans TaxID=553427 RepID=A0A6I0F557_9FIRM|nr:phosphoenolpyruvate carboxykinase [Heliorestis acidaminivorans]KAB2954643.1 phosphoenolpyruvate carboxykinase [Heliorestis acidaminivorans]